MTTLPRRRLLDIWKVLAAHCATRSAEGTSPWPSGDSLLDGELLISLLYPAMRMPGLGFADPDTTNPDVLAVLAPLGDHQGIPVAVAELCLEYLDAYASEDGHLLFDNPGRLRMRDPADAPTPSQLRLETVESFSTAVTLSLSVLAFVGEFERRVRAEKTRARLEKLRRAASTRLTHAMTALREAFVADVFTRDSDKGRTLLATVFPDGSPDSRQLRELLDELRPIRLGLRGLGLPDDLLPGTSGAPGHSPPDDEELLFACGWTWGRAALPGHEDSGYAAAPEPSLYFTSAAMDGIVDLFSSRQTLLPGLLNNDQLALTQQLLVQWELAQRYWSALARFGGGDWPLQDIPWRVCGGQESAYSTLQVASIVIHNLMRQGDLDEAPSSHELRPLVRVLSELAARARLTRRVLRADVAVELHAPGVVTPLVGAERWGPHVGWAVSDFAPMLLKRTLQVAALTRTMEQRDRLLALAGELTDHLWNRRLDSGRHTGLWDAPERVFPAHLVPSAQLSLHLTERAMEVLVVSASGITADLAPSPELTGTAADMLREAEHLLAQEMLTRTVHAPATDSELHMISAVLHRSRAQAHQHPAVAVALTSEALRRLDALSAAREQAARGMI